MKPFPQIFGAAFEVKQVATTLAPVSVVACVDHNPFHLKASVCLSGNCNQVVKVFFHRIVHRDGASVGDSVEGEQVDFPDLEDDLISLVSRWNQVLDGSDELL